MDGTHLKDTVKRVAWTFVQAFVGVFYVMATGIFMAPNLNEAKAAAVAAVGASIAAGVSAVKNLFAKQGSAIR
jgi:hypothetical protein